MPARRSANVDKLSLSQACHTLLLDLAYGTVCQASCKSQILLSDCFDELTECIYLVTDSCSTQVTVCFVHRAQIYLLTYYPPPEHFSSLQRIPLDVPPQTHTKSSLTVPTNGSWTSQHMGYFFVWVVGMMSDDVDNTVDHEVLLFRVLLSGTLCHRPCVYRPLRSDSFRVE